MMTNEVSKAPPPLCSLRIICQISNLGEPVWVPIAVFRGSDLPFGVPPDPKISKLVGICKVRKSGLSRKPFFTLSSKMVFSSLVFRDPQTIHVFAPIWSFSVEPVGKHYSTYLFIFWPSIPDRVMEVLDPIPASTKHKAGAHPKQVTL